MLPSIIGDNSVIGSTGFGFDSNKIYIIDKNDKIIEYKLKQKVEVAKDIFKHIIKLI